MSTTSHRPLAGLRVLDFSTLLPGPMCTLLLAEAGADVIKIERPGQGDEMRTYTPRLGADSVNFALLNRGKRSITLDLKQPDDLAAALELIDSADILVEQFRAGVMERLGLGAAQLRQRNPRLIYCSITGYGQSGPLASVAGHDLNYLAETGMLGLSTGVDGAPGLPQALIADLAGGAYPAVMNILLALRHRDVSGEGSTLDIAMTDNLFPLMYWGLGDGFSTDSWPQPGAERVTGGTPRYQVYRTADQRWLAVAPLEQKFWVKFLQILGATELLDDSQDPAGVRAQVAQRIAAHPAAHWEAQFQGHDVCVSVVRELRDAVDHPHFKARGLFQRSVQDKASGKTIPALPVPIQPQFCAAAPDASFPSLGEANQEFLRP